MITGKAGKSSDIYVKLFPFLKQAFDFISDISGAFPEGRHKINENMYAVIETSLPKQKNEQKLEAHKKYTDLQFILEGEDIIGWKDLSDCKEIYKQYDGDKDIMFFNETPDFNLVLGKNSYAVFFPDDAHSPLCGKTAVKKCIIKINSEILQR